MYAGGIASWLLQLARCADRSRLAMDFLVYSEEKGAYDEELLSLGARIFRCPRSDPPWLYAKNMWRALRTQGSYDVVHSHVHHYSGLVLTIAALAQVPVRIAHSHSDTRREDSRASASRRLYLSTMKYLLRHTATAAVAASTEAAVALFGESWPPHLKWSLLRCAIDLTPFRESPRFSLREELGIRRDSFVIGHVGRFVEVKNHAFLISIAQAALALDPAIHFLLVGEGPLREDIERRVATARLNNRFTFAGQRSDIPALMVGAMDAFVLPSLFEGLPLVLIEAQAAGLPCLVSDTVSPEANIVNSLFFQQSLSSSPQEWAAKLLSLQQARSGVSREQALRAVAASPFEIHSNLDWLQAFYRQRRDRNPSWTS
jgi:glycosyltransferase involved in cell wall biosynthesis